MTVYVEKNAVPWPLFWRRDDCQELHGYYQDFQSHSYVWLAAIARNGRAVPPGIIWICNSGLRLIYGILRFILCHFLSSRTYFVALTDKLRYGNSLDPMDVKQISTLQLDDFVQVGGSSCGWIKQHLTIAIRAWTCASCGEHHDRDVNASKNEYLFRNKSISFTNPKVCGLIWMVNNGTWCWISNQKIRTIYVGNIHDFSGRA